MVFRQFSNQRGCGRISSSKKTTYLVLTRLARAKRPRNRKLLLLTITRSAMSETSSSSFSLRLDHTQISEGGNALFVQCLYLFRQVLCSSIGGQNDSNTAICGFWHRGSVLFKRDCVSFFSHRPACRTANTNPQ